MSIGNLTTMEKPDKIEREVTAFFTIIEKELQRMEYGSCTINVQIVNGLPVTQTINIVNQRRRRYKIDKYDETR